jgi:hypothetical protein
MKKDRAQQWCCKVCGPLVIEPASDDVSAYGDVRSNKAATELSLFCMMGFGILIANASLLSA